MFIMLQFFKLMIIILVLIIPYQEIYSFVAPVRINRNGNCLLVSSGEIKLVEEYIDLYHHPLGIWLVECRALLKNIRSQEITQTVGFPSGFDVRMIEGDLYCNQFEKFRVFIDDQEITKIDLMMKCPNYVKTTGTKWSLDDGSGIGFLNTWKLNFKPDEAKWITVSFNFVVKKVPPVYNPDIKELWYIELINWVKQEYSNREENNFQLPLNIGSFWAFYPDSLIIRTYIAKDWLKVTEKSQISYLKELITRYEFSEPVGFYSPPNVELESLTIEILKNMSQTELAILRNSFAAKYGRKFDATLLKKYFENQPWYIVDPKYDNWYLTQWDINNMRLIYEYEKSLK